MEIDHHPIACAPELMRQRRVRIERGEVPGSAHRMQDRQPGLAAWIEAFWCDLAQRAACRPFPVLAIDVEQQADLRLIGDTRGEGPDPGKQLSQRAANHGDAARAEAGHLFAGARHGPRPPAPPVS